MLLLRVTLCLLITYHWPGCSSAAAASTGLRFATPAAGIAAEVNGSPTDARLNIPVVKRSSNQAAFANELRSAASARWGPAVPAGGRGAGATRAKGVAATVVEVVPTRFELPHEYANRDVEKYTAAKETAASEGIAKEAEENKKATKEKGNSVPGIKSSIAEDAEGDSKPARLIGKAAATLRLRGSSFDYEGASSVKEIREEKSVREKREAGKKADRGGRDGNHDEAAVGSVFPGDSSDKGDSVDVVRIRRQAGGENSLIASNVTIDGKFATQPKRDDDDVGVSNGWSSSSSPSSSTSPESLPLVASLKPTKQPGNAVSGVVKILDSRGQHQQSRNTRPSTIIQHLRRNAKRQISEEDSFTGRSGFDGKKIAASGFQDQLIYGRNQREANHGIGNSGSSGVGPELRFIPANRRHRNDNRVYFQRTLKPLMGFKGFPGGEGSPFGPGEANPPAIGRFSSPQFESLENSIRGVFDKYEARQQGQADLLPNVRTIQPNRIFVAPPRLIYDTKILPAPFGFDKFFSQGSLSNENGGEEAVKGIRMPGFALSGVFDQGHRGSGQDQREVIPVREEDSSASLTNTGNFVTPLPTTPSSSYRAGGEVSVRVNQPGEEPNVLDEIYRVSGEPGVPEPGNESQPYATLGDEDSRANHESTIGDERHLEAQLGGRGSSYDNSAGATSAGNRPETGSTNVDHSAVIEGTADEYVNRSPTAVRTQSTAHGFSGGSGDNAAYDRGSYKWRDDNNHMHYAANYSFGYRVSDHQTENEFGHQETRTEGITNGKYHVRLPDGRIQKVNYHVDDDGYHASVSYQHDE